MFTSPVRTECGMFVMCCLDEVRYINVCCSDAFSVVNMYLDHMTFCFVCINSQKSVVVNFLSLMCDEPTPCFVQPIGAHSGGVMYFGSLCFRSELGFLNCDNIGMCVVRKQFELLEFV